MNILIDGLPSNYNGIELITDYRSWIQFELLLLDKNIPETEKGIKTIELTIADLEEEIQVEELEGLIDYLLWFYGCGKKEELEEPEENEGDDFKKPMERIYSFEHDAEYIYSAFLECYGIDLVDTNMHWWKFKALLKSLNENCMFSKILGYRSIKISSKMTKEEQRYYTEMKKIYGLPDKRSEEEKESDFANTLFASF